MKYKLYLQKNKDKKEDKHPDLKLSIMLTDENGQTTFIPAGAFWKSKSGKGYTGDLDTEAKPYEKPVADTKTSVGYDGEVIDMNDIPFN
jgi:hypothetical protein